MSSFALYRLPYGREATLVRQLEGDPRQLDSWRDLNGKSGFVVAPFAISESCPLLLISPDSVSEFPLEDDSTIHISDLVEDSPVSARHVSEEESYAHDFRVFHDELCAGRFRKLVLSRCSELPVKGGDVDAVGLFRQACLSYPRLFISLVYTPQSGLWLTATPEILLESIPSTRPDGVGEAWRTIALAGTMPLSEQAASDAEVAAAARWSAKDIEEQRLVASYIADCLHRFSDDVREDGPRTVRAAHLLHLRSDFTFTLSPRAGVGDLLQALHPTPAVCGLPKEEAFQFIQTHEHTPRRYYSGFMGPINVNANENDNENKNENERRSTHLYVTLRCMELSAACCRLYAGGGLLKESSEQSEWQETEAKLDTMRRLLPPFEP